MLTISLKFDAPVRASWGQSMMSIRSHTYRSNEMWCVRSWLNPQTHFLVMCRCLWIYLVETDGLKQRRKSNGIELCRVTQYY